MLTFLVLTQTVHADGRARLVGFASLPADTFAEGRPSGADDGWGMPIGANGRTGPFDSQPVQGFSAGQFAPGGEGLFLFLSDNGFGSQTNSADYLLRIYQLRPDFLSKEGGGGDVAVEGFVEFADPDHQIPFQIVNGHTPERRLTGADFDPESLVVDARGDIWVGDEFGPFILHFDHEGTLLEPPIATPDLEDGMLSKTQMVRSPENPYLADPADANLGSSRGFEGMAFSLDRQTLYPMLEGTVDGDREASLRIYRFDVRKSAFEGFVGFYLLDDPSHAIGEMTPINDDEFLIIERDGEQGASARFKKIFKIDIRRRDAGGFFEKTEVADLLDIADPNDLDGDGKTDFAFPFETIESVLILSEREILVANDNNYPFSIGRGPDIDDNEFIVLRLPQKLQLDTSARTAGKRAAS
ncbi:MAG: esterase-like activity of phytase family protein [Myxococcota bacterium]